MSTTICISGQARTFRHCFHNINWHLFSKVPDPVFFVSVADDEQARDVEILLQHYPKVFIEYVTQPTLPEPPEPHLEAAGWGNSSPPQSILRQLWHLDRVWAFAHDHQKTWDPRGSFIRCRPDIFFRNLDLPLVVPKMDALVPYWGGYGGVNDRLAIMPYIAADLYFSAFQRLDLFLKRGCPLHPETIMARALGGHYRRILRAEFNIVRLPAPGSNEMRMVEAHHRPSDVFDFLADLTSRLP